jgi:hypothetical protein
MSYQITNADGLVAFVKAHTGSTDTEEIKDCIHLAELQMRNLELPVMRSDPYSTDYQGTADANGRVAIPDDMLKPIQFFQTDSTGTTPSIVYDRVGDREIIESDYNRYGVNATTYTPRRGTFSEVGLYYQFNPKLSSGDAVNMYYYRSFPFLFSTDSQSNELQNNGILTSFPEGYVYATLHEYYLKRKNYEDAQAYLAKYQNAVENIEDQNAKGKWAGGNRKMSSAFSPRKRQRYMR